MKYFALVPVIALATTLSCAVDNTVNQGGDGAGTMYVWTGADMDATADITTPDVNWGGDGYNRVALATNKGKRSYIHFMIHNFPEGTTVLEAHMELYHGAKNEDGMTDDIDIPFQEAGAAWSAMEITWNNQPPFTPGGSHTIDLISQSWSPSDDIAGIVQGYIDDPSSHLGVVVYWVNQALYIEKGFSSNNDISRTAASMGKAPRLLAKINLPDGKTIDDVTLPGFPAGTDLDFPGEEILMFKYSSAADWPADWNVVTGG